MACCPCYRRNLFRNLVQTFHPLLLPLLGKQEGSERDDVVGDDLKPVQDIKRDPKKGLLSNGASVSDEFRGIRLMPFNRSRKMFYA